MSYFSAKNIGLMVVAVISLVVGSEIVHRYYKPLQDFPEIVENKVDYFVTEQGAQRKKMDVESVLRDIYIMDEKYRLKKQHMDPKEADVVLEQKLQAIDSTS